MDNLTHTLFGLVLAKTSIGRSARSAVPVLLIGSNLPDLDILVRVVGGHAGYLEHHRGLTHAVVGIVVQIAMLTLGAWLCERMIARERAAPNPWSRGSPLAAAAAGLLAHPLLDLLNEYGLRPWLPFSGRWVYGDLVFIVDPWLWLILGGAAACAGPRTRRGDIGYGVLAFVTTALFVANASGAVTRGSEALPTGFFWLWIPALALVIALRLRGIDDRRRVRAVRGCAVLLALYFALLTVTRSLAERAVRDPIARTLGAAEIVSCNMSPRLATPLRWECIVCTADTAYWFPIDLLGDGGEPRRLERRLDDPRIGDPRNAEAVRAWRTFTRHALVMVDADGRATLTDARYWFTDFCRLSLAGP
ncbi:MAG: metal-dependent hydrolase [Planctomycetes bacterium]|nr:metal-dependent hydrolase [Planctomycetota bacterium]MCC7173342.1 metal-dependent hydrolase [Planctomycetota bacterium]